MNIKVCGITQLKQLQQLDGLEIQFCGPDFHPPPRVTRLMASRAAGENADFDLKKTSVFRMLDFDFILRLVEEYGLDVVRRTDRRARNCEDLSDEVEVKVFPSESC
ncbi:MAG: hypothetical protein IPP31_10465 [Chitinophagaceae bacterium]|nr:hypothetical protein [Chitinophagaceae bacterium]